MKKIFSYILKHKIYFAIILVILCVGGYYGWQKFFVSNTAVRYVIVKPERGALVTSISGTGQVSALNQVDIKTKASGDVIYVGVKVGQEVKAGVVLVQLNASEALKSVRDAQMNLESARLSMEKLQQPADALSIMQAENSLAQARESKTQSEDSLKKSYESGFNNVTSAFLTLPSIISGLNSMLFGNDFENSQSNNIDWYYNTANAYDRNSEDKIDLYYNDAKNSYTAARNAYDTNFNDYKSTSRLSSDQTIEALILETYETSRLMANAIKNMSNFVDLVKDIMLKASRNIPIPASMTTHQSSLSTYTGQTNGFLTNLLSTKQSIEDAKNNIVNYTRSIAEKTESLANLKAGTDPLDIQSQQLSIKQKENALLDAQANLANYSARAPFDGVVAQLTAKKGDSVSAGASLGALLTKQSIATIALNEIDIAKIKMGQKAILTFDAVDGLSITGEVVEIDNLGTTSQGVVSYNVKIAFDLQDERIKSGMSVSAVIILDSKPDVLMVQNSAIKTQGDGNYVEILVNNQPQQQTVTIGANNDTMTEIVSGLSGEEDVIKQTITSASSAINSTQSSNSSGSRGGVSGPGMFGIMR